MDGDSSKVDAVGRSREHDGWRSGRQRVAVTVLGNEDILIVAVPRITVGGFGLGTVGIEDLEFLIGAVFHGVAIEAPGGICVLQESSVCCSLLSSVSRHEEVVVTLCLEVDGVGDDAAVLNSLPRAFHIINIRVREVDIQFALLDDVLSITDDGTQFIHFGLVHLSDFVSDTLAGHQFLVLGDFGAEYLVNVADVPDFVGVEVCRCDNPLAVDAGVVLLVALPSNERGSRSTAAAFHAGKNDVPQLGFVLGVGFHDI